jgi:ferrous iron transport protein B
MLFVADASQLSRALPLFAALAAKKIPMAVALTMTDVLAMERIDLDVDQLEKALGVPILSVCTHRKGEVDRLRSSLGELIQTNGFIVPDLHQEGLSQPTVAGSQARHTWTQGVLEKVEKRESKASLSWSQRIDQILLHRFWGLLIFVGAMYLMFQAIYTWAVPFMDLIDAAFGALAGIADTQLASMPMLRSLVSDGLIAGVGSVVIFLPQILILFLFVAVMEDSGYLARVAFLMDKLLSWTGLSGRAFVPMLSGFACAIPAIMATRVMPDPKARLATILITPLMSCSARLPVYLLLISAFIEPQYGAGWAAFALFAMHGLGLLIALPLAWVFNRHLLKSQGLPFVMEMPRYHRPKLGNVLLRSWKAGQTFLVTAGTIIFALSIVIWALSYFPRSEQIAAAVEATYEPQIAAAADEETRTALQEEMAVAIDSAYLEHSYLGQFGHAIQPVFAPLGFDWRISVGILSAFPAREVIVSTLGILYTVGEADEESPGLKNAMSNATHADGRPVFNPLVAIVLMIFFALCSQCMSTLATIKRELNSWGWVWFVFFYMTALAYLLSLAVYQIGMAVGFGAA